VPQIWLTYDELAALMDCDEDEARRQAATIPLDRRRSRDGRSRVKLTLDLTEAFVDKLVRYQIDRELAACAGDLNELRQRMAELDRRLPRPGWGPGRESEPGRRLTSP
jgi:hypothetical protein